MRNHPAAPLGTAVSAVETRARRLLLILAWAGVLAGGCAHVEPGPDYDRAMQMTRERTGAEDVYDPRAEAVVEQRVVEILAGGLTVDEAVRTALLNNPGFQQLFLEIGASRADVVQSALFSNPTISLSAQFPEAGGRSKLSVGVAQQIADLWQIPVRKRLAQARLEQTILSVVRRATELTAEVKAACYRLLALREAAAVTREHVGLVQDSADLVQRQFQAGEVGALDVNLAKANVVDARLELLELQREEKVAEAELLRLLGLGRRIHECPLTDSLPRRVDPGGDVSALLAAAGTQRLDARVAESRVQAAEDEVVQQYLHIFPDVAIGLDFERPDRRALPGRKILADTARESVAAGTLTAPTIESRSQRDLERRQIVDSLLGPSIQATLPIWDQNQAQIAKARVRALQARKEYEDLLDSIAEQVQRSWIVTRNASDLVQFYETEALPQARENVDGARKVLQAGEQSVLVLIEVQESLIRRQRAYIAALRDQALAMAELESAVGGRATFTTTQPTHTASVGPKPSEASSMDGGIGHDD